MLGLLPGSVLSGITTGRSKRRPTLIRFIAKANYPMALPSMTRWRALRWRQFVEAVEFRGHKRKRTACSGRKSGLWKRSFQRDFLGVGKQFLAG